MARVPGIDDLFGHVPQQGELVPPQNQPVSTGPIKHTPETIRALIHEVLGQARAAKVMPWNADDLRYNTGMFPYWAEWLKGGEGDALMAEFKAEMDRLDAPIELIAPNWKRIWGIAA